MAKLDLPCLVASEISAALAERRDDDAKRIAVEQLRAGYQHQEFWDIVAVMLEPKPKREPGRKGEPKKHPSFWLDIGQAFLELGGSEYKGQKGEKKYDDVIDELIDRKWGPDKEFLSRATITNAVAFYREAILEHDAVVDSEMRGPDRSK